MAASGTTAPASERALVESGRADRGPAVRVVCAAGVGRLRPGIVERIERAGFSVIEAATLARAIEQVTSCRADACVLDLTGQPCAAAVRQLCGEHPNLPLVGIVDPTNPAAAAEAVQHGLSELLAWPFEDADISLALTNVRDRASLIPREPESSTTGREPVFAQSAAMRDVVEQAGVQAASRTGVMLCGEPGTGRSALAEMIHRLAGASRPFEHVDCSDGTPEDVERRLFGVVLERPSGRNGQASTLRVGEGGALVTARGGTLYLSNVTELPARVQSALARLLRDREAWLGNGRRLVDLDVRPIAAFDAAGGDEAVDDGRLQGDLLERVSQARIDVPPLRRRREDIPALAAWKLRRACAEAGVAPKAFSRSALSLLAALPWHGNGRELDDVVGRTIRSVPRAIVQLDDLLAHTSLDGLSARVETGVTLREARSRFERDCISAVLRRHHGRVGEAAKALGIQRTNLYRKVRQLKVPRSLLSARK